MANIDVSSIQNFKRLEYRCICARLHFFTECGFDMFMGCATQGMGDSQKSDPALKFLFFFHCNFLHGSLQGQSFA